LFWLTHIPVPDLARQSGVSDKTMHVLAYFVLTFLVWFAVCPYQKVQWNKPKCWWVILAVMAYGVLDELLQARVGRSADLMDWLANFFGVMLGLGLLSVFGFWTALLSVSAVFMFVLSDMSRLMTLPKYAKYASAFHFTAYAAFTLIWIQWLERFSRFKPGKAGWPAVSLVLPIGLLLLVKLAAPAFDRPLNVSHMAVAAIGIAAAALVSWGLLKFSRKTPQGKSEF
jgi:hypothetical protein